MKKQITLLEKFINKKAKSYKEPQRRGVKKGDIIGFSRKKYLAALYSITNSSQREVARFAGTSTGVVLKWRTEQAFREKIDSLSNEFIAVVADYTLKQVKEVHKVEDKIRQWHLSGEEGQLHLPLNEIEDAKRYSNKVRTGIMKWATTLDDPILAQTVAVAVLTLFGPTESYMQMKRQVILSISKRCRELLQRAYMALRKPIRRV